MRKEGRYEEAYQAIVRLYAVHHVTAHQLVHVLVHA